MASIVDVFDGHPDARLFGLGGYFEIEGRDRTHLEWVDPKEIDLSVAPLCISRSADDETIEAVLDCLPNLTNEEKGRVRVLGILMR